MNLMRSRSNQLSLLRRLALFLGTALPSLSLVLTNENDLLVGKIPAPTLNEARADSGDGDGDDKASTSLPGPGQTRSSLAPVLAKDETSTLQTKLGNVGDSFPVLSATQNRITAPGSESAELSTDFYVDAIRTDESGAYVISYLLDDTQAEVTIEKSDCTANNCAVTFEGRSYCFWSWTSGTPYHPFEHKEFKYFSDFNLSIGLEDGAPRTSFVFGVKTENLPDMGSAVYHGRFRADSYKTTDPSIDQRQRYHGAVRLVANFDMSELDGRVYSVRGTAPGESRSAAWPTSGFTITDGQIQNGQFTATLTGVDSDPEASFDASVRDFMGQILGEFYGPDAEEIGGVVTAARDVEGTENDRVLAGFIGDERVERLADISDSEPIVTSVYRDHEAMSTAPSAIEMPTVESTENGFRLTYTIDGATHAIDFGEGDLGHRDSSPTAYVKRDASKEYWLRSETGSFTGVREFDHFDVNGWALVEYDTSNPDELSSVNYGFIVYGARTPVGDMPATGEATYSARVRALEWPGDDAVSSGSPDATHYRDDLSLVSDFGDSSVNGNVANLRSRPGNVADYVDVTGGLTFDATIDGNSLSADGAAGTGAWTGYTDVAVNGAFYGPGAAEVGGVLEGADAGNNKLLSGWFGGKKE